MSTNAYWITRKRMLCYPTKMKTHWGQTIFISHLYFSTVKLLHFLLEISYTINIGIWEWMVFCYQNCSDLLWEKIVLVIEKIREFEAEGREFAKFLRSVEQFIQTVKGQNYFWQQNAFLTCSWRFLRYNKLEQL